MEEPKSDPLTIEEFSFERTCRVCLKSGDDFEYLFPIESASNIISFAEQINQCSDIPWVSISYNSIRQNQF